MSDTAPAPFRHDQWLRYNHFRLMAGVYAGLGGALAAAGFGSAVAAMSLQGADLATMEIATNQFWGGQLLAVLGIMLASRAPDNWLRARRIRHTAEARSIAETTFVVTIGATIIQALNEARDGESA